jgi:galacturan 1,4-alpha-galacturonidase
MHGRPHAITISDTTESVIEGLRFVQSQMWTMTVARSERVLLQDIYVNSTSGPGRDFRSIVNTDGVDVGGCLDKLIGRALFADARVQTVYANNITFLRWIVSNGDDSISMKQNSTNIYIANCTFYKGLSFAMGSIGQYPGQINVIENVTAENIILYDTIWGGRIKTVRRSRPCISLDD